MSSIIVKSLPAEGQTLLDTLRQEGIDVPSPCGGAGTCGKCKVHVVFPEGTEEDVLACQTVAAEGMSVTVPDSTENAAADMEVSLGGADANNAGRSDAEGLGLAFDVGTTTLVARLYDLHTGAVLANVGAANPQRSFGADVISRISAVGKGHLEELHASVNEALAGLTAQVLENAGASAQRITRVALAGNTVMEHLACGVDPSPIGVVPFTPPTLFGQLRKLSALESVSCAADEAYVLPCVAGYVGGDITADLLALDVCASERPVLMVDLGTNGEIALGSTKGLSCCATAAGPVFEGANIKCGMPAYPGAISQVRLEGDDIEVETIDGEPARGICGTGLIDTIALLLELGIVDEAGVMLSGDELAQDVPDGLTKRLVDVDDVLAFEVAPGIAVTQRDVRNVQLAKAAICAGIATLMDHCGLAAEDIAHLDVAGGFGQFLNLAHAARIGLIPAELLPVARSVGNTAIEGAGLALSNAQEREKLEALAQSADYVELSTDAGFNMRYVDHMEFPSSDEC